MYMKWILVGGLVVVIASLVAGYIVLSTPATSDLPSSDGQRVVIGLSLGTLRNERWVQDRDHFVAKAEELGASVLVVEAADDPDVQVRQAESLILQGVDVLVVVASDATVTASIVDKAHEAGIKVIAYDRLILNESLDYYISFDNVKVGEHQAREVLNVVPSDTYAYVGGSQNDNNAFLVKERSMRILQPHIESGQIQIVYDEFHDGWRQEVAYEKMRAFLQAGNTVDAVVAANDTTALGVIQALSEVGLAGKVPVSGQDASLASIQKILEGEQTVSIYKPIRLLAEQGAMMAVSLALGEDVEVNNVVQNGGVETPAYLLDVVPVTIENIDETVIADGFHDEAEVYGN